jgi:3D (Asp-Asp-Asp) domain-containing protein
MTDNKEVRILALGSFILGALVAVLAGVCLIPSTTTVIFVEREIATSTPPVEEVEEKEEPQKLIQAKVTAFTSDPAETDSTPNITASGYPTGPGIVANNCLPFGTEVEIAGEVYEVLDRMNERYGCEWFDIWVDAKHVAYNWGVRHLPVVVNTAYASEL